MDPLLIVFGFGVGVLVGMTGMGGGSLMTPLLVLLFGVTPTIAVASDIAYQAITKTVGGWRHFKLRTVNFDMVKWLALGSVPGAISGV
ncbi:MAG: sulfite exporter TauE/SafE family protein, partial [Thermoleophilaceae bacterium]|nr:sulfite exporter TauE/SafE family protein [Thermoleophilaceae bacterium]